MAKLGISRKEMWGGCSPCEPSKDYENEIVYPCLDLQGAQVEIARLGGMEFGEEATLTVKVRVSRVGGQSQENETPSMAFDVLEIESAKPAGGLAAAYQRAASTSK